MTTVTVSFRIPAAVHAALKREAERDVRSLNQVAVKALQVFADGLELKRTKRPAKARKGSR